MNRGRELTGKGTRKQSETGRDKGRFTGRDTGRDKGRDKRKSQKRASPSILKIYYNLPIQFNYCNYCNYGDELNVLLLFEKS